MNGIRKRAFFQNSELTTNEFKTFFKGGEYVIAGKASNAGTARVLIEGDQATGNYSKLICIGNQDTSGCDVIIPNKRPAIPRSDAQNFLERMWAFLTIKNLLDETQDGRDQIEDIEELKKRVEDR